MSEQWKTHYLLYGYEFKNINLIRFNNRSHLDWIGINYYTRSVIKYLNADDGINYECERGSLKKTDMGWELYPKGLSYFIERIHQEYSDDIPIYVTENGMANNDQISSNEVIEDQDRVEYFQLHLKEILDCLKKGIQVKGYFAWSLLDNYEWAFGYEKRFGLIHVDFETFKRTPKESFKQFSKYLWANEGYFKLTRYYHGCIF